MIGSQGRVLVRDGGDSRELLAPSFIIKGHSRKVWSDAHWIPSLPWSCTCSFQNSEKEIPITYAIQFVIL